MTYLPPDLSRLKALANLNLNGNNFHDVNKYYNRLVFPNSTVFENPSLLKEPVYKSPLRRTSRFHNENPRRVGIFEWVES